jgi:hypothetical protein
MNTTLVIGFVVLACVAAAVLFFALQRRDRHEEILPFEQVRPLTEREQVLYWRLRKVMPDEIVLAQVAVSRILKVRRGYDLRAWMNRVDRMTVDFVVCLPDSTIVAAIELDDASHGSPVRIARDDKKNKALAAAGIKLLRYATVPDEEQLKKAFLE